MKRKKKNNKINLLMRVQLSIQKFPKIKQRVK